MPTKKQTTETTTKKKAPAKKAATKKPAAKKPAAKKAAPKKFSPVTVYLLTNAPANSDGARNMQFIYVEHADGTLRFKTVKKYEVVS